MRVPANPGSRATPRTYQITRVQHGVRRSGPAGSPRSQASRFHPHVQVKKLRHRGCGATVVSNATVRRAVQVLPSPWRNARQKQIYLYSSVSRRKLGKIINHALNRQFRRAAGVKLVTQVQVAGVLLNMEPDTVDREKVRPDCRRIVV